MASFHFVCLWARVSEQKRERERERVASDVLAPFLAMLTIALNWPEVTHFSFCPRLSVFRLFTFSSVWWFFGFILFIRWSTTRLSVFVVFFTKEYRFRHYVLPKCCSFNTDNFSLSLSLPFSPFLSLSLPFSPFLSPSPWSFWLSSSFDCWIHYFHYLRAFVFPRSCRRHRLLPSFSFLLYTSVDCELNWPALVCGCPLHNQFSILFLCLPRAVFAAEACTRRLFSGRFVFIIWLE